MAGEVIGLREKPTVVILLNVKLSKCLLNVCFYHRPGIFSILLRNFFSSEHISMQGFITVKSTETFTECPVLNQTSGLTSTPPNPRGKHGRPEEKSLRAKEWRRFVAKHCLLTHDIALRLMTLHHVYLLAPGQDIKIPAQMEYTISSPRPLLSSY